jgi:hypothetical protein
MLMTKNDHDIGLQETLQFFHRKCVKITESSDHNIDQ